MAGRWEVGEDAGLHSLAKSVEQELSHQEGKKVVRAGAAVVHEEVQALVAACWKEKRCEEVWQLAEEFEDVLQIWIFNSLRYDTALILPLLMAMCSHDCSPNAFWSLDPTAILQLRAARAIRKGEEVTISYLSAGDLCLPSLERQKRLQVTKDFLCSCERCSSVWDDARVFVCPRCQGEARASKFASCVGAFVGAGEHVVSEKLRGAVVELCGEEEEAVLQCGCCGSLSSVEAASLLVPEKDFADLLYLGNLGLGGLHVEHLKGVQFPEWSLLGGFAVTVEGRTLWFAWPTLDSRCP
eukprot:symbB.v1.2.032416.t1/scaffold3872.1/size49016/2